MQLEFKVKNLLEECNCLQALHHKCHKINLKTNHCMFLTHKYKIYRNSITTNGTYYKEFIILFSKIPSNYSTNFRKNLEIANTYRKHLGITTTEYNLIDLNQVNFFINDLKHEFEAIIRAKNYQYTADLYINITLKHYYKILCESVDVFKINPLIIFNKDFLPLQQCFNKTFPSMQEKFIIFMPMLYKDPTKNIIIFDKLNHIVNKK